MSTSPTPLPAPPAPPQAPHNPLGAAPKAPAPPHNPLGAPPHLHVGTPPGAPRVGRSGSLPLRVPRHVPRPAIGRSAAEVQQGQQKVVVTVKGQPKVTAGVPAKADKGTPRANNKEFVGRPPNKREAAQRAAATLDESGLSPYRGQDATPEDRQARRKGVFAGLRDRISKGRAPRPAKGNLTPEDARAAYGGLSKETLAETIEKYRRDVGGN